MIAKSFTNPNNPERLVEGVGFGNIYLLREDALQKHDKH